MVAGLDAWIVEVDLPGGGRMRGRPVSYSAARAEILRHERSGLVARMRSTEDIPLPCARCRRRAVVYCPDHDAWRCTRCDRPCCAP